MLSVSLRFCRLPAQRHAASHADPVRHLLPLLSPAERKRCARLPDIHAQRAIVARALVRSELAAALGTTPSRLAFVVGRHGKPALLEASQAVTFNLSHSGDWVVLAWHADHNALPLGVDVEQRAAGRRDVMRLARRYFSRPEQLSLEALAGPARELLFYRLWTLKEAWVKAHGLALAPQLGAVSFSLHEGALGVANATDHETGRFLHGDAGSDACASLCVLAGEGQAVSVDARMGMPLGDWSPMSLRGWTGSLPPGNDCG